MTPSVYRRSAPTWTTRARYLLALGLVALLSVTAFLLAHSMIQAQAGTAAVINTSGAQRMLSQRTTLLALQLTTTPPGPARDQIREQLRADLTQMISRHAELLNGVRGASAPSNHALTALQTIYFGLPNSLDPLVQAHARRIGTILATPDVALRPDLPVLQEVLQEAPGELLDVLDAAVRIHQTDAEARTAGLRRLETGVLGVTLLTLLLEGLLIFRPLERELARRSKQLIYDAFHDALTGLPNRALFMSRLEHALLRHQRYPDVHFAVLFLDCDRFKVINDSLGHDVGDAVLIELGARLQQCVRGLDTVARLGGDEFTLLLEALTDVADARVVCDRIAEEMARPFVVGHHTLHMTASIGLITSDEGHATAQDILRDADLALYRAKALGRARTEVFTPALRARADALLNLEQDLRYAQARGELSVHYQPLVALPGKHVLGFEALARWTHPQHGVISPGEFIPVAEDSGLIIELDRFVLHTSCMQVRAWQAEFTRSPPLTLSVNLSGRQLERPDLVAHIEAVLRETGFPAAQLKLELTESVLAGDSEQVRDMLFALKGLGVQLHIDDFGTGYSNLSYLQRFPADAIKIDRSFIQNLSQGKEGQQLVKTIIAMAYSLNLDVVAEGVETESHCRILQELGCSLAQGYLFSQPLPVSDVSAFLASALAPLP